MTVVARNIYDPFVAADNADVRGLTGAGVDASHDGRTKQGDLKESDINFIMKRYEKTGQVPAPYYKDPVFGDFSSVPDFQESLNIVNRARDQFYSLEAHVRSRFENDPAKYLAFVNDPANFNEAVEMGIFKKRPPKSMKMVKGTFVPTADKPAPADTDFVEVYLNPSWKPRDGHDDDWPTKADYSESFKPV